MNNSDDDFVKPNFPVCDEMDLPTYRQLVSHLPAPSEDQVEAFVDFVSHAHSWYKHLRLTSPRSTFQFFLDPQAGMQRVGHPDGTVSAQPRTERGFHYSWIPTQQYRQRFGFLAFSQAQGTAAYMKAATGDWFIPSDGDPAVINTTKGTLQLLPPEVLEAGAARVSGLIHTIGANSDFWAHYLLGDDELPFWPEESGGRATMEKMRQRCEELHANRALKQRKLASDHPKRSEMDLSMIDYPFYLLVEPERERQLGGMADAIHRLVALLAAP
jgi:hypothetical protein